MSHTGKWDTVDYDKQFKEDLEKAQALSLESLALEKFRLEKQRAERSKSDNVTSQTLVKNVTKKGSSSYKVQEAIVDSRYTVTSYGAKDELVPKLPPPPSVLRRNSVTTNVSASGSSSANDLISFHSPTGNKDAQKNPPNHFDYKLCGEPDIQSGSVKLVRSSSNASDYQSNGSNGQRIIASRDIGFDLQNLELSGVKPLATLPFQYNRPTQYSFISPNTFKPSYSIQNVKSQPSFDSGLSSNSLNTCIGFNGSLLADSSLGVLKVIAKRDNANLIDLTTFDKEPVKDRDKSVRVSLLEAFDPLLSSSPVSGSNISDVKGQEETYSEGSIYDPYDPFDYLYSSPSLASQSSDPVYSAVVKAPLTPTSGPPLPPRNSILNTNNRKKVHCDSQTRLYENLVVQKRKFAHHDSDLIAFHAIVKKLRGEYSFSDKNTNVGLVISSTIENHYNIGTSVKLIIHYASLENPFTFTCDVSTSVEHIIMNVACELENGQACDFVLKVIGLEEYLDSQSSLAHYEYVHQCIKLEKDIELSLVHVSNLKRPLARTAEDDRRDSMLTLDDLLPKEPIQPISYDSLLILLETLEKEMERIENASREIESGIVTSSFQPRAVMQAVKAVCALLGNVETLQISQALDNFINVVEHLPRSQDDFRLKPEIVDDYGDYSVVRLSGESFSDIVLQHCEQIRASVQGLIEMYSHGFRVDFQLNIPHTPAGKKLSSDIVDTVLIHIGCLHRLPQKWNHDNYILVAQLYHGTRPIGHKVLSDPVVATTKLYHRVVFDCWLNFEGTPVSSLPRECRIVIVIYGQSTVEEEVKEIELGWAAVQMFNFNGVLIQGNFLLPLWSAETDKRFGPAPSPGTHPFGDSYPVIGIELPDYGGEIYFPPVTKKTEPGCDFSSLDQNTQQQLMEIIAQDIFSNPMVEDREVLWEKRHYLINHPQALPKVLLAALSWDYTCLPDLHSMLYSWSSMDPVGALQLLLPCFPDMEVRAVAVQCINGLSNDQLVDFLPQMVQALKHETYEASPLSKLLLERSLKSPRVAHHLYWLLIQALPGQTPQNTCEVLQSEEINLVEARYHRRFQLMLRSLLAISGDALRNRFMAEQLLVKGLTEVAENVKASKEATRLNVLMQNLHSLHASLEVTPTCLPLGPSLYVTGIHVRSSSYFPSNTLPLKINFTTNEDSLIPAIFKVGDDLQQDMLSLQMIRVMDKLWLKEGLDLKMVTFECVPTGHRKGMIEMVTDSETLRKIQVEFGLTGSFKDRPIAEWLAKHNPSALEYERAVANFTASCAGYSVATYVLGICDRHNDNIMLKTSGHLFHIDFGKFLGDAQMFGNFKRDRTPFVLTSDMAYVINGGDKPSARFHHFVDLCCQAFNIVRRHGNILLNLFGLMVSSGAGGLTADAVRYVQTALLPELSNAEAAATFARMIQSSLKSWFTQFNFFLHNLAQLRFSGDHNDGQLLSFVNKTYTMQQEGRLKSVDVYGYQKRYDPEKYYVYILRVERFNHTDPVYLFRSYKEFCEFHQKLCIMFPLAKCHSLQSTGLHMGRSNIKQVAEKRLVDIKKFLSSLFNMADEICHSDLVYTFFHPLLRDQQDSSIHEAKLRDRKKERVTNKASYIITGQIKLSLHYQRETFRVMVHHIRELSCVTGGQEPSTYVKVYLLPDPNKSTKRKTKVVRRSCHPSFMEMLEYRLPLEIVQHRTLQATVWNHDTLQENEFLGGTTIRLEDFDISNEVTEWYPLGNVHR